MSTGERYPTIGEPLSVHDKVTLAYNAREERRHQIQGLNESDTLDAARSWEPIKVCVFDLYGTLVYFKKPATAYQDALSHASDQGIWLTRTQIESCLLEPILPSELLKRSRKPLPDVEALGRKFDEQARLEALSARVYPDALSALQSLVLAGIPWTIGSNLALPYSYPLKLLPIPTHPPILSYEVGCKKPYNEFFQLVQQGFKLRPEQILFIGDQSRSDIDGALRAGMRACLIARNQDHPTAKGALRITALDMLPDLLNDVLGWTFDPSFFPNDDPEDLPSV